MNQSNPKVDFFFEKAEQWRSEFEALRQIALDSGLIEDLKWGVPCYTLNGKNIILIHGFKEYCGMLFVKGALVKDPHGILIQQTDSVQSARQARFTNLKDVVEQEPYLRECIQEAIEVEKSGRKVLLKKVEDYVMAEQFQQKLEEDPVLEKAFYALTPGRQRAYLLFFAAPKQGITREARVEKCIPLILAGKGLNDK